MNNRFHVGNLNCNSRYVLDVPQFDPRQKQELHGCPKCPKALGSTRSSLQGYGELFSLGVKRLLHETDH